MPPPVRTIPKTLPQELITDMWSAIIDSTAEGKGVGSYKYGTRYC